jgi:hypothetical protein
MIFLREVQVNLRMLYTRGWKVYLTHFHGSHTEIVFGKYASGQTFGWTGAGNRYRTGGLDQCQYSPAR